MKRTVSSSMLAVDSLDGSLLGGGCSLLLSEVRCCRVGLSAASEGRTEQLALGEVLQEIKNQLHC